MATCLVKIFNELYYYSQFAMTYFQMYNYFKRLFFPPIDFFLAIATRAVFPQSSHRSPEKTAVFPHVPKESLPNSIYRP